MFQLWLPALELVAFVTVIVKRSFGGVGVALKSLSVAVAPPFVIVWLELMKVLLPWRTSKLAAVKVPAGAFRVIVWGLTSWPVELAVKPTV